VYNINDIIKKDRAMIQKHVS